MSTSFSLQKMCLGFQRNDSQTNFGPRFVYNVESTWEPGFSFLQQPLQRENPARASSPRRSDSEMF